MRRRDGKQVGELIEVFRNSDIIKLWSHPLNFCFSCETFASKRSWNLQNPQIYTFVIHKRKKLLHFELAEDLRSQIHCFKQYSLELLSRREAHRYSRPFPIIGACTDENHWQTVRFFCPNTYSNDCWANSIKMYHCSSNLNKPSFFWDNELNVRECIRMNFKRQYGLISDSFNIPSTVPELTPSQGSFTYTSNPPPTLTERRLHDIYSMWLMSGVESNIMQMFFAFCTIHVTFRRWSSKRSTRYSVFEQRDRLWGRSISSWPRVLLK